VPNLALKILTQFGPHCGVVAVAGSVPTVLRLPARVSVAAVAAKSCTPLPRGGFQAGAAAVSGEAQEGFAPLKVALPPLLEDWPQGAGRLSDTAISVWPLAGPPLAQEVLT
jgi:hypothetical protein